MLDRVWVYGYDAEERQQLSELATVKLARELGLHLGERVTNLYFDPDADHWMYTIGVSLDTATKNAENGLTMKSVFGYKEKDLRLSESVIYSTYWTSDYGPWTWLIPPYAKEIAAGLMVFLVNDFSMTFNWAAIIIYILAVFSVFAFAMTIRETILYCKHYKQVTRILGGEV